MASTLPGRPIWLDLCTHDVDGAKSFYGELFGWEFSDQGEDFGHYTIITKDGRQIAGLMSSYLSPEGLRDEPATPTVWSVYLQTDDLDGALAALPGLGGQVVFGPMDVADLGRQGLVVDPAGAYVGLWQPKTMTGVELTDEPGTPVWFECLTKDMDKALPLYRDVLHWQLSWMGTDGMPTTERPQGGFQYATNGDLENQVAGLCDASDFLPEQVPSFWRVYIGVEDADATVAKLRELGGTVMEEAQDSPFGRFAQVTDPQGAIFMINQAPAS